MRSDNPVTSVSFAQPQVLMWRRECFFWADGQTKGACEMSGYVRIAGTLCVLAMAALAAAGDSPNYKAEGVVRGPSGQAVSGARVALYIRESWGVAQLHGEQTTGADGAYRFAVEAETPNGYGMIVVQKAGLAWNCRRWSMLGDEEADIALARPVELSGAVVDEQAKPIAGARVSLMALRSSGVRAHYVDEPLARALFATETDEAGRFRFEMLSADWQVDFVIEADGYATLRTQHLPDSLYTMYVPGQAGIRFVMRPEARIRGKVVSETDGAPLAGIEVRVGRTETGVAYGFESATSDADGAFSFRGIPDGEYWVGPATLNVPDTGWAGWPVSIRTKAGETTEGVKLELTRGGMFAVDVDDSAGRPIEGAGLTVFGREGSRLAQGRTDATGLWKVRLPAGAYKLTDVGKHGYHSYEPYIFFDVVDVEVGETVRRSVTLREAERLAGVVVDAAGRGVSDVRVSLMPSPVGTVYTDKRGRFAMTWDKWYNDYGRPRSETFELIALDGQGGRAGTLKPKEGAGMVRVALEPAVRLTGTVVDAEGEPVASARVSSWLRGQEQAWGLNLSASKRILTDAAGRFTIYPVPAGRKCEIRIRGKGYETVKKELRTPTDATGPFDIGKIEIAPTSAGDG